MEIFACVLSFMVGATFFYLVIRSQLKDAKEQDIKTEQYNLQLQLELKELMSQKEALQQDIAQLTEYHSNYTNLSLEKFELALENAAMHYQDEEQEYQNEYLKTLQECADEFLTQIEDKKFEIDSLTEQLRTLRASVACAVEAAKRDLEKEKEADFYRLNLSEEDILEISKLREVIPYLRDKETLNKVIYKCYYEKPYTDLIGRVIGANTKTGIYKITNIENNMCYVGQAVNIADRWKQHIKRGVGAETAPKNKLYPVMYAEGPENFTFEVIEECDRLELDAREDFWQDFFKAKEFGYSIK